MGFHGNKLNITSKKKLLSAGETSVSDLKPEVEYFSNIRVIKRISLLAPSLTSNLDQKAIFQKLESEPRLQISLKFLMPFGPVSNC